MLEKLKDKKIERLESIILDQEEQINDLMAANDELKAKFEIEQQLGAEVRGLIDDLRARQKAIDDEYKQAFELRREYRELVLNIKNMRTDYEKELKGIVKGARKEAKKKPIV